MKYYKLEYKQTFLFFFRLQRIEIHDTLIACIKRIANNDIQHFNIWEIEDEKRTLLESSEFHN